MNIPLLVTTEWLESQFHDPHLRIVDCRWVLGQAGEGRRQYETAHIPGAVHLDVDEHLSGKEGPGRHPLPRKRDFDRYMSASGINRDTHVVVYDAGQGVPAARLWWLLRYFGHEKVSVLNGGWSLWQKEGRPISGEVPHYREVEFISRPKLKWVVDKTVVDSMRDDPETHIIDARSPERYRGEVEPIDPKAGHIPGAENFPYTQALDSTTGLFLSPEKLREALVPYGLGSKGQKSDKTVICYCGSGVTACTVILALKTIGVEARLYEGSWSDWCADSNLSIA